MTCLSMELIIKRDRDNSIEYVIVVTEFNRVVVSKTCGITGVAIIPTQTTTKVEKSFTRFFV